MAIEAPYSKYRKQNCLIIIAICLGLALWCAYDGFFNEEWIEEHKDADGNPQAYLTFNRKTPPYLIGAAVLAGIFFLLIRNKKITAEENELVINDKEKISYDSIQKIDRTNFDSKGFFVVTYKTQDDSEITCKIKNKTYDNLKPILEHLVAKIS